MKLIDNFPTHKTGNIEYCMGRVFPFGAFIKGGAECAPELYRRIRGSDYMYGDRGPVASINFVTCHDGFTLYDLVSYNEKHNEANGEDNRDGCSDNCSRN